MKNLNIFAIALVILISLAMTLPAKADYPAPGGPFSNYFYIQNKSGSTITCIYTIYTLGALIVYNSSDHSIAANESKLIDVRALGLETGTYTAVVNCSGTAAVVSNFADYDSGASFLGSSSSGTWYLPGLYDNYYNYYSTVIVQNATGNINNVTLDIYEPGNTNPVLTLVWEGIPAYDFGYFELEGQYYLYTNVAYSGKITASGNVVPIVNIYGRGSVDGQLYSYNGYSSGSLSAYAPLFMKSYYNNNSSLNVQNIGNGSTSVTVTYSNGSTQTTTIQAKSTWSTLGPPGLPNGLYGAIVTSNNHPIILLVNESNAINNRAASYKGLTGGYTVVHAPSLERNFNSYNSSVTCQMVSNGGTPINIDYYDGSTLIRTVTSPNISNGQTFLFYQGSDSGLPSGWHGSAKIYSNGNVACIINQDMNEPPKNAEIFDQLFSYEGIP